MELNCPNGELFFSIIPSKNVIDTSANIAELIDNLANMKKRYIGGILMLILFLVLYLINIFGWYSFQWNVDTSRRFLNNTKPSDSVYKWDREKLLQSFSVLLKNKQQFFNDSSLCPAATTIIIDTILYSPDLQQIGTFVIAQTPTSKQLIPQAGTKFFYNSTCYLGMRKGSRIELRMIGPTFSNANNLKAASENIREECFRHFIVKNSDIYSFNLNDKRFWKSKIWEHYFDHESNNTDTQDTLKNKTHITRIQPDSK